MQLATLRQVIQRREPPASGTTCVLGKRLISPQYYVANTVWRSNWSAGKKKGCAVMEWNAFDVGV